MRALTLTIMFVFFSLLLSISFVSAAFSVTLNSNKNINISQNSFVNLTITAPADVNITNISISFNGAVFVNDSNWSSASSTFVPKQDGIRWDFSPEIENGSSVSVAFNITPWRPGRLTLQISAARDGGGYNTTDETLYVDFPFTAYVKFANGTNASNANVTIYAVSFQQNMPPISTLIAQTQTDSNGMFSFAAINGSAQFYKLKIVYYNQSDPTQALKTSAILPEFPAEMFYPSLPPGSENLPAFMRPPSLNGTTFYLFDAATIFVNATNGTDAQLFGYEIMDQATGMSIESNIFGNVSNVSVVVPAGRNYTVMVLRDPTRFIQASECVGNFMNDTHCPTPPFSRIVYAASGGHTYVVEMSLDLTQIQLTGCVAVEGNSTAITNISVFVPYLLPFPGFVPPIDSEQHTYNIGGSVPDICPPNSIGFFNISLFPNSNYIIDVVAFNSTIGGEYLGYTWNIQNTSAITTPINITLRPLLGKYYAEANKTSIRINLLNSTGGRIGNEESPHVELVVNIPETGKLTYMFDEVSNGTLYHFFPNNTLWAKLRIFPQNGPPVEYPINLSATEINITLPDESEGFGLKKINESGMPEEITNLSELPFEISFLRADSTCMAQVLNPSSSCVLTTMTNENFNPMKALVAGKVNMQMRLTSSNVRLIFANFDMFSAKPPTNTIFSEQADNPNSAEQIWRFGSFVPTDIYDYVLIGMPYSDSVINESADIRVNIPYLYNENWQVEWQLGVNTTSQLPYHYTEFADQNRSYNSTGYVDFLSTAGVLCSKTNSNMSEVYCYVNTTANMIWIKLPHFSGVAPKVIGQAISTTSETQPSTGGSSGTPTYYIDSDRLSEGYTKYMRENEQLKFSIDGTEHTLKLDEITASGVKITISSEAQTIELAVGETAKVELTGDNYYDLSVKLESIEGIFAKLTLKAIHEEMPAQPSQPSAPPQEEAGEEAEGVTAKKLPIIPVTIVIVLVIVVGVVIGIIASRRNK